MVRNVRNIVCGIDESRSRTAVQKQFRNMYRKNPPQRETISAWTTQTNKVTTTLARPLIGLLIDNDGVRLCLSTAATSEPIVRPPCDM
jgi:hypothetical protein